MKILCWLGFHKWNPFEWDASFEMCLRCEKERQVIKVIYEHDARRMGVSEEAIKRGYFTKADIKSAPLPATKDEKQGE